MTLNEAVSSPKVLATHGYRSSVGYVGQPTPGEVERNTESTDRRYALAERAAGWGWARDAVELKGTLSEAGLHVLRARLDAGLPNMANRGGTGSCRSGWSSGARTRAGIPLHPDGAVTGVIAAVFTRFAACGSVHSTWSCPWEQHPKWPLEPTAGATSPAGQAMRVEPTSHAVHTVFPHPACAGAYRFRRARAGTYVAADGVLRTGDAGSGGNTGRCSSPTTTRDTWTGTATGPTGRRIGGGIRPAAHLSGTRGRAGGLCCAARGWPAVGPAGAKCPSITTRGPWRRPAESATAAGSVLAQPPPAGAAGPRRRHPGRTPLPGRRRRAPTGGSRPANRGRRP
jgi:hypothetical protein